MKRIIYLILFLLAAFQSFSQEKVEYITMPVRKPDAKVFLELNQVNGNILVEAYDGKDILIKATFQDGYKSDCTDCKQNPSVPPGMKRIESSQMELRAYEENNQVTITTESWKRKTNLEIKVPANIDMRLGTVQGSIEVKGVTGDLELSGVNGGIRATGISGSLLSNTVNGDILVTFKSVNKNACSFVTLNGDVDVTLPSTLKSTAKMKSARGEIYSDFDMTVEPSKQEVKRDESSYEVSINPWVLGKINGGGPEYTFQNMNGNIIVRKGN